MKEKSLVDLFDLYDQAFDKVCDELDIPDRPPWQYRWFYRYYQINLIPQFLAMTGKLLSEEKSFPDPGWTSFYKWSPEFKSFEKTYYKFYSTFTDNFPIWWYKKARNHFSIGSEEIHEFMKLDREDSFSREGRLYWVSEFRYRLMQYSDNDSRSDHRIIFLPLLRTKEETVKLFEKYLDETGYFSKYSSPQLSDFHIPRVKVSEKSVKDCYRLLEYRVFNPNSDLVDVALNSGIKKSSIAGLDKDNPRDVSSPSLNSVRAGMNILNKQALNLLYGSSEGIFPSSYDWLDDYKKWPTFHSNLFFNYYEHNPKWLFELVRNKMPHPDNMHAAIKADLLSLTELTAK